MELSDSDRKTIALDLGGFAAGLTATWFLGWSTRDLLWGMWISSLMSGLVFFVASGAKKLIGEGTGDVVLGSIGLLFGLAFFGLHFGMFHYIQASILDLLIPLEPDPGRVYIGKLTWKGVRDFSMMRTIVVALSRYWVLIAATLSHGYFSGFPDMQDRKESFQPYIFVLKMHFLMFFLGGLYVVGLESFPVYVIVLFFFFTPSSLKLLFSKKSLPEQATS